MRRTGFVPLMLLCLMPLLGAPACGGSSAGSAAPDGALTGPLLPAGPLHTQGSQIVDALGRPVRIASVGWFDYQAPPYTTIQANVAAIAAAGFNAMRLRWV